MKFQRTIKKVIETVQAIKYQSTLGDGMWYVYSSGIDTNFMKAKDFEDTYKHKEGNIWERAEEKTETIDALLYKNPFGYECFAIADGKNNQLKYYSKNDWFAEGWQEVKEETKAIEIVPTEYIKDGAGDYDFKCSIKVNGKEIDNTTLGYVWGEYLNSEQKKALESSLPCAGSYWP